MKKLWVLSKFEVGISFIPFLVIILFSGSYNLFFTYFLITLIHELGHVITAKIFKVKTHKIRLNIFGFSADIDEIDYLPIHKQFLIIIMGPLTYFVSLILIRELYLNDIISLLTYYKALSSNKYILIFNLLPIFPLDGGRIAKIILDKLFTYKKAKICLYFLSFIFMVGFVFYTIEYKQYLMYIFLVINFVINVMTLNKNWKLFLLKRYSLNNKYKDKLHKRHDLYMYKNNYLLGNKEILNEKEAIIYLLKD